MANLMEIRQKYPQYSDLSDQDLADRFHNKFYSDMPKEQFYQKIGYQRQMPINDEKSEMNMGPFGINPKEANQTLNQQNPEANNIRTLGMAALLGAGLATPLRGPLLSRALQGAAIGGGVGAGSNALSDSKEGLTSKLIEGLLSGSLLGAAGPVVGSVLKYIPPATHAKNLLNKLGFGAKTSEENAKSMAMDLKNAYEKRLNESLEPINPLLEQHGSKDINKLINPTGYKAVRELPQIELKLGDKRLNGIVKMFNKKPTFQNAHNLQSEIGNEIGWWQKQIPSNEKRGALNALKETRNTVKNQIYSGLENIEKGASNKYKEFQNLYRENVVPYSSDKTLRSIIRGEETNPKNLHNLFEYPTEKGQINKILQDLPGDFKNKILFSYSKVPSKERTLLNRLIKAEKEGYSTYFNPEIKNELENLEKNIDFRDTLKNSIKHGWPLAGAALGAGAVTHHYGSRGE